MSSNAGRICVGGRVGEVVVMNNWTLFIGCGVVRQLAHVVIL